MIVQKSQVEDISELLNQAFDDLNQELGNARDFKSPYLSADVMDLNKSYMDSKIATVFELLKQLKAIKELNPKKPYKR